MDRLNAIAGFGGGGGSGVSNWKEAVMPADVTVNNTTTVAPLTGLEITLEAGKRYVGYAEIAVDTVVANIKYSVATPADRLGRFSNSGMQSTLSLLTFTLTEPLVAGNTPTSFYVPFIIESAGGGTMLWSGGQVVATLGDTTFRKGSRLLYREYGP